MNAPRTILILCLSFAALHGLGCRAEKPREIRPAERVELLQQNQNDPRPYFHAELKFADPQAVKLPGREDELRKRIRVREAGSLFAREGKEFTPFRVINRATEATLDLMLLFDLSGSMNDDKSGSRSRLEIAKDAARVLLENFRLGDRIAIAPFESHDVRARIESAAFADTKQKVEEQINELQARQDGNTALYSATILALGHLQKLKKTDRQYMLVVLTDGKNDVRQNDDPEVRQRNDNLAAVNNKQNEANIQTFTIGVGAGADAEALKSMVYPAGNSGQYSDAADTESLRQFLAAAKKSLTDQIGIEFFTARRDYRTLRFLNFNVRIESLDGKIYQGLIPFNCSSAAGCTPDKVMEPDQVKLVALSPDAPQPPPVWWKELLWLLGRFALAIGILAGLWWGVPKLVWPGPSLPGMPIRGAVKLPPSRATPKAGMPSTRGKAGREPGSPPARPRDKFEETRIHDDRGNSLRNRDSE